jgi:hypothetical protein
MAKTTKTKIAVKKTTAVAITAITLASTSKGVPLNKIRKPIINHITPPAKSNPKEMVKTSAIKRTEASAANNNPA